MPGQERKAPLSRSVIPWERRGRKASPRANKVDRRRLPDRPVTPNRQASRARLAPLGDMVPERRPRSLGKIDVATPPPGRSSRTRKLRARPRLSPWSWAAVCSGRKNGRSCERCHGPVSCGHARSRPLSSALGRLLRWCYVAGHVLGISGRGGGPRRLPPGPGRRGLVGCEPAAGPCGGMRRESASEASWRADAGSKVACLSHRGWRGDRP